MQAHIILPHHHHDDHQTLANHSHKHGQGSHNHDKQDSSAKEFIALFSHASHPNTSAEILHSVVESHAIKLTKASVPVITETDFLFKFPKIPDASKFASSCFIINSAGSSYSFLLRGPPAFSV